MSIHQSRFLLAALVFTCGWVCMSSLRADDSGVRLWTAPSMDRVFLRQAPAPDAPRTCEITACRNESESVQVVATGTAAQLAELTFTLNKAVSDNGESLPAPTIFWQYDVLVRKRSPDAPFKRGLYPDALVPFTNGHKPHSRAFRNYRKGRVNFRLWIDFNIPAGQKPGRYKCSLTAGNGKGVDIIIDVQTETLPNAATMKSIFGIEERRVARAHGISMEHDAPRLGVAMSCYYELMRQHRISPGFIYGTCPKADSNGMPAWSKPVAPGLPAAGEMVRNYFRTNASRVVSLPMWDDYPFENPLGTDRPKAVRYLAELARFHRVAAPDAKLVFFNANLDEPNDKQSYLRIRRWASFVHEAARLADIDIAFFLTEQPEPQNPSWGSLVKHVNIWSPHVMWAWEDLESKSGKRQITRRIEAGDEVWCYAALSQFRTRWMEEKGKPDTERDAYPPVWLTDYPAIHFRILPWICAARGLTGIHYWDIFTWKQGVDPWKDAGVFVGGDEIFNGDGLLIYPPSLGITSKPCASIRLKWIRDGMDDYDHLMLLKKQSPLKASGILALIARGFADWETSPGKLAGARKAISNAMTPKLDGIPMSLSSPQHPTLKHELKNNFQAAP